MSELLLLFTSPSGTQTHVRNEEKPSQARCGAFMKGWQRTTDNARLCIRCQKSLKRKMGREIAKLSREARR